MTTSPQTANSHWERLRALWDCGWLKGCLLVVAVVCAYQPALQGKFVWDDDSWTTNISKLLSDFSGLRLMWCQPTALQQYYPLTGTTFWLDYHLWGFWPLPYHVENVLLHALAALLFWRLLQRLQVPGAGLAGAILALHPLMVESVGWITERKNVLSLLLYLGALLAYGRFTRFWPAEPDSAAAPDHSPPRWRGAYVGSFLLFLAALLAKATAFSLPAVLLLICWWKRGRIRWRADVVPALPFFALAIGLGMGTAWLEKHHVGASGPEWNITFPERCLIAGRALWFYAGKLFWPANLCFVYPRWQLDAGSLRQWLYPVTAVGALGGLWLARARIGRGPATAGFYFVGTLFPVLGFLNAYFMRYSFVCDHWAYLSSLGLIALASALIVRAVGALRAPGLLQGLTAIVLSVLALLTWRQSGMYADVETLWHVTINRNPDCSMAYNNLGYAVFQKGRVDEAIAHFQKALEIKPDHANAHYNLGNALLQKARVDEAIIQYQKALEIQPVNSEFHNNLGNALLQKARVDEAIAHFQKALEIKPDHASAHYNLGNALFQKGRADEAIIQYQKALEIDPEYAKAHNNLGNVLLQKGLMDEAIAQFQMALELKIQPDAAEVHNNLGNVLFQKGRVDEAIAHFQKALELKIQSNVATVHNNLGNALLQKARVDEAIIQFQKALESKIQPGAGGIHNNLGNALFQKGRVDEAIIQYQKALEIQPAYAKAHYNLGNALLQKGRVDEAIAQFQKALEIQPVNAEFHNNLGYAFFQKGQMDEAITQLQAALEIRPDYPKACYNLARVAWELATSPEASVRNGAKAVALAETVERLSGGKDLMINMTLAAAYAEAGRFSEAVATAERARQLAATQNNTALVNTLRGQIGLYQAGTPFRDASPTNAPTRPGPP